MDFDAASKLLIIYSIFVKYVLKWECNKAVHLLFVYFKEVYDSVRREVLYNIPNEFDIPMKLVRLIKMCLNETYSSVRVGKHLFDMFPIRDGLKQGVALSQLLFYFGLEYTIRRVRVNHDGLKINSTHQLLVYVDDVNILGGSVHTIKKSTDALVVASNETGLLVNGDKTKYMVMSRYRNAGRSHSIKIDNSSLEGVEDFKYLGITVTNQNSFRREFRADLSQGMVAVIRCRIFVFLFTIPKYKY